MRAVVATALVLSAGGVARAEHHVVEAGETVEAVADIFHCTVDDVLRANDLDTTLVPPGTVLRIPATCNKPELHARAIARAAAPRTPAPAPPALDDDDARARAALAVIDGVAPPAPPPDDAGTSISIGEPWHGALAHGRALPPSRDYLIRHPARAFGADHVIAALTAAIADVHARFPALRPLAIGDLSAEHGGKISDHVSHQSGLDVDVGFYPRADGRDLDLAANWALVDAFDRSNRVQLIFLDRDVQARLYRYAAAHGASRERLERVFQYPRGKDVQAGLVRHWPNHADHFHVRFLPAGGQ